MDIHDYASVKSWLLAHVNKVYHQHHPEYIWLSALVQNHPHYALWKYQHPARFKIKCDPHCKLYVQFHPLLKEKTKYRVVSWVSCCTGRVAKTTPKDALTDCMRLAIKRQMIDYRRKHPDPQCCLCAATTRIEVDHHPLLFSQIRNDFLLTVTPPTTFDYHFKRGCAMFKKSDKLFKTQWQKYHRKHAQLRYLCSSCNKLKK